MVSKILITTCLEFKKFKDKKKILFAGDWCLKDEKIIDRYNIFPNIWDNYETITKDYKKIKKIHKKILNFITNYLYEFHNQNFSKKILSNLIYVWLTYYLFFYYFKWQTISKIFKYNDNLKFAYYETDNPPNLIDSTDFYNISSESDYFNYHAFKQIIDFKKTKGEINVKIIKIKKKLSENFKKIKTFKKIKKKNLLLRLILLFQKKFFNPKILIVDGINFKFNFFLNLFLLQFPFFFKEIFNWNDEKNKIKIKVNLKKNKHKKKELSKIPFEGSSFETFIFENIFNDIPLCFTSGLNQLNKLVKNVKLNPEVIISGSSHVHNEFAKLWMLKQKYELNKKLIILSHGGAHQNLSLTTFDYDHKIGDCYFGWVCKNMLSKNYLPNTKYSFNTKKRNRNRDKIVFVGNEIMPYINRISPGPKSISSANIINDLEKFSKNLKKNIRDKLYYSPKKEMIKHFFYRIKKIIKRNKILPKTQFNKQIKKSKLVVCTYPQTTFFDSLLSGPTILIYNPSLWRHYKSLNDAYKILKKNNIIFEDAVAAAKHINIVWNDLDKWWNKKNVLYARNFFLKNFNLPPKNQLSDISKSLKIFRNI